MRHYDSCYKCTYFQELKRKDGSVRMYCNDRDCTVEPDDPDCNYDEEDEEDW